MFMFVGMLTHDNLVSWSMCFALSQLESLHETAGCCTAGFSLLPRGPACCGRCGQNVVVSGSGSGGV